MVKRPRCGEIDPTDGKLRDGECVNALRVAHLHIHTFVRKYRMLGSKHRPWPLYRRPLPDL